MGGIADVAKPDLKGALPDSKKPKDVLKWSVLGGINPTEKKAAWKTAMNPLPYKGEAPAQAGPKTTTAAMTPEEEAAIKRRRAQGRQATTVLSSGDGETLGG